MRIVIATPAPPGSTRGNRRTAERWGRLLEELGHDVQIVERWNEEECELLIAVHARHSADSVRRFREEFPERPLVVLLAGTDLYRDLEEHPEVTDTLEAADRIVLLQPAARDELPSRLHDKSRVIVQSAGAIGAETPSVEEVPDVGRELDSFQVCMLAHVRDVKDPLVAARAVRRLPEESAVEVVHAGGVLEEETAVALRRELARTDRYRWLGELPHREALVLLSSSAICLVTSRLEGGANVVSEALATGVPVVSTRIPGTVGLLGGDYPGYFGVGDDAGLAELLMRAERDESYYDELERRCVELAPMVSPARERAAWERLLAELSPG